jgi:hypothetical protein
VAHEQLLRKWPTLTRWLEEQREFLIWKGDLAVERREWEKLPDADKPMAFLTGRRLLVAQRWLRERTRNDSHDPRGRLFIEASIKADEERQHQALLDKQRLHETELQAARDREHAAKRMARRTVLGVIGLTAIGGVAGATGYRAVQAEARSKRARDAASALEREVQNLRDLRAMVGGAATPATDSGSEVEVLQRPEPPPAAESGKVAATWAIGVVGAENSQVSGKGCVVAIIGSGVDVQHPAFRGVTFVRRDFTGTGLGDRNGHSTHTAGSIFGRPFKDMRFGIAPGVTEVLDVKVLDASGAGRRDTILAGLQWAMSYENGRVDVICVALGEDFVATTARRIQDIKNPRPCAGAERIFAAPASV